MEKMRFSRQEYNIALNTMDLILSGEVENIFKESVNLKEVRDKIRNYAFIRYDEIEEDIVRINITANELDIFANMYGYGIAIINCGLSIAKDLNDVAKEITAFVKDEGNQLSNVFQKMLNISDNMLDLSETYIRLNNKILSEKKYENELVEKEEEYIAKHNKDKKSGEPTD